MRLLVTVMFTCVFFVQATIGVLAFAPQAPCDNVGCAVDLVGQSAQAMNGYILTITGNQDLAGSGSASLAATGVVKYYDFSPACSINANSSGAGTALCQGAAANCPQPGQIRYYVFEGTTPGNLPQVPGVTVCLGPTDLVSAASLQQLIAAQVTKYLHLPSAVINVAPPAGTLVNLPTIFWTDQPGPETTTATIAGASVTITASPTYTWSFGDGSEFSSRSPGHAYTPTVDPAANPSYYIEHTFARQGTMSVTLSVSWSPTYTIDHVAGTFTVAPVTREATRTLVVQQAQAVLSGNS